MGKKVSVLSVLCWSSLLLLSLVATARADTIYWTNWSTLSSGSASGSISFPNATVFVTYTGQVRTDVVDNTPDAGSYPGIALVGGYDSTNLITFSRPVINPILAVQGLGRAESSIYDAFTSFHALVQNPGDGSGTIWQIEQSINGWSGNGAVQFNGSVISLSWLAPNQKIDHMFTVGAPAQAPLPASLLLFTPGLVGLIGLKRKYLR